MSTQAQPGGPLAGAVMLHALADHWWVLLLRGAAALIFGFLTFLWPGITLLTLTLFWGAFALVDGVLAFVDSFLRQGWHRSAALVASDRGCRRHRSRNPLPSPGRSKPLSSCCCSSPAGRSWRA